MVLQGGRPKIEVRVLKKCEVRPAQIPYLYFIR